MVKKTDRKMERRRRHIRVRRKVSGTAERPRLCVYRSNANIYAQIIDDVAGNTLVQASTLDKEIKIKHANKEAAKELGTLIAKRAADKKIKTVVFDRGGYIYHGVVKELAEELKNRGINSITTDNEELALRLKFYNIDNGDDYFLSLKNYNYQSERISIKYYGKELFVAYLIKIK